MKTIILASTVVFSFWCANQGPDAEEVFKGYLQSRQDVAAVLVTVKDKITAEAAILKLEEALPRLVSFDNKVANLTKLEQHKLLLKFEMEAAQISKELDGETRRLLKQTELQAILRTSKAWGEFDAKTRVNMAKTGISNIETAVLTWQIRYRALPDSLQQLAVGDGKGGPRLIVAEGLTDPWGRPYQYVPNVVDPNTAIPLIFSYGPNLNDDAGRILNWGTTAKPNKK